MRCCGCTYNPALAVYVHARSLVPAPAVYVRARSLVPAPTRRAVFRRQRQRDLSLWTPIHRLRAGRKSRLRQIFFARENNDYLWIFERKE